jgi:hypothetical protein
MRSKSGQLFSSETEKLKQYFFCNVHVYSVILT